MQKYNFNSDFSFFYDYFVSLQMKMTRLEYWIKAQTQYRVHSPFLFEMYRKVLFARVEPQALLHFASTLPPLQAQVVLQAGRRRRRYVETVYKVCDHYHLQIICFDADEAVLQGKEPQQVKVVCQPHRRRARELRWMAQQGNAKYDVSIDMFDVGLLLTNPKLHRQHFVLK